jgi:hypothetical protein
LLTPDDAAPLARTAVLNAVAAVDAEAGAIERIGGS